MHEQRRRKRHRLSVHCGIQHLLTANCSLQYYSVELALSQSADPHAQLASSFAEVPSVILQAAYLLHVLSAAMQNIPVELALSQSADPHAQLASSFAEVPSVILQTPNLRHLFSLS